MPHGQDAPPGTPPAGTGPPPGRSPLGTGRSGPPWADATAPLGVFPFPGDVAPAPAQPAAPAPGPAAPARRRARGTDPVGWLIALAAFAAYATISVLRYRRLQPGSWDLGIYTEYIRQIAHLHAPIVPIRQAGFNLLGDHFQPAVALLAPFFRVFPSPVTLLVAQALLTALSVIPVSRAARELTGHWVSRAIVAAYAFSWGLQQLIDFDFHELAFAVPLLACSLSALVRGRPRAALWWALPLVFVKEDQGFTVAVVGVVMLGAALGGARGLRARAQPAARRRTWAWAGAALIGWGLAWSALAIMVIIPHFSIAHHYQYWQDGGVIGPGRSFSLAGLLSQLSHAGGEKLATAVLVLLPVAFLALASPLVLAVVPTLALRFLSTNGYYWGTGYHYNAVLMPIVFLAAVDVMARLGARPHRSRLAVQLPRYAAALMLLITGWLAIREPLAGLWQPQTYAITPHVRAEEAAIARVPSGTTVEATLTMLAPLAARDDTSWVGTVGIPDPLYLVFDATNSGWTPLPAATPLRFLEERHPGTVYQQVFRADGVYVFRRTWPAAR